MAAQRLGSILTNVTGTSNQILRVNTAETGFEFVSPASLPAYTVTNDTTDRVINANDTNLDEMADVLSTLIKDMATIYNGGPAAFTWSTSEQVWPFEKSLSGETLYCKAVNVGTLPNTGVSFTNHNISSFAPSKLFKLYGYGYGPTPYAIVIPCEYMNMSINSTQVILSDQVDWTAYSGYVYIVYAK